MLDLSSLTSFLWYNEQCIFCRIIGKCGGEHAGRIIQVDFVNPVEAYIGVEDEEGNYIDKYGFMIERDEDDEVAYEDRDRLVKINFNDELGHDLMLRDAIKSVEDQILYVVAAGNESNNNDLFYSVPDVFGSSNLVDLNGNSLVALKNVISVAP